MNEKVALLKSSSNPTAEQKRNLEKFLFDKYASKIQIEWMPDANVKNGFILQVGNDMYDWSLQGRVQQFIKKLKSISGQTEDYVALIQESAGSWSPNPEADEIGHVISAGYGIAIINGLEHCSYNEILIFENGVKAVVLDIRKTEIASIVIGDISDIEEGTLVYRSYRTSAIPVGNAFLGRVIDSIGTPIDAEGSIKADSYYPIERQAPAIFERKPVTRSMATGILAVDSMFPIGRGQRELIIGDRQSGKTTIAIDSILHQKGKDVICIYVAIGQKTSSVARLVEQLKKSGAMDYTVVLAATAADSAAMQYLAPYAGTAMAEYFMHQGKDVLIIYDDLSKHAVAYRSISLLLERFPGREAYPGDVFYLHSRLLERSAQLSDAQGGGSITSLPIVETQQGDISAYIPTNIISITDGQIFLETELFFAGQRPAINVGLSVSRVGGAAQSKAMKKASSALRLNLAQYREMKIFTQFASDLDESSKKQLRLGAGIMELLKQKQHQPLEMYQEVIILVVAMAQLLVDVEIKEIKPIMQEILLKVHVEAKDVVNRIQSQGILETEDVERILAIAKLIIEDYALKGNVK